MRSCIPIIRSAIATFLRLKMKDNSSLLFYFKCMANVLSQNNPNPSLLGFYTLLEHYLANMGCHIPANNKLGLLSNKTAAGQRMVMVFLKIEYLVYIDYLVIALFVF
jgi:hypothetical protein